MIDSGDTLRTSRETELRIRMPVRMVAVFLAAKKRYMLPIIMSVYFVQVSE